MIYEFVSPWNIYLPRVTIKDKKISVNLNTYRNLNKYVEGQCKHRYTEGMGAQLLGVKLKTPIEIIYQPYKPTRTRLDKMNVASITSKYFLDALVFYGCISDDNDDYIKDELIKPTIYDKNNGRVEITIKEL